MRYIKIHIIDCSNSFFSFLLLVPHYECFMNVKAQKHCKILKISPRAYIFQWPFIRGLYSKGLIYSGKFALPNGWI